MTMSTSSAPASTASATSASLTASEARPDGNAVATEATATGLPASSARAVATRSGYTHTAATGGAASESTAPLPGAGGTGTPARAVSVMAPGAATVVPDTTSTPGLGLRSSAGIPGYIPRPGIRTTESLAARAVAKPGLMIVLMIRSRSSKGAKALFIALIVSHSISDQP